MQRDIVYPKSLYIKYLYTIYNPSIQSTCPLFIGEACMVTMLFWHIPLDQISYHHTSWLLKSKLYYIVSYLIIFGYKIFGNYTIFGFRLHTTWRLSDSASAFTLANLQLFHQVGCQSSWVTTVCYDFRIYLHSFAKIRVLAKILIGCSSQVVVVVVEEPKTREII